ncbi:MAG: 2-succinyl-5-enolpyruvyl-6-hydroxy-3-cyclohexene-1-carboxylic-acid synthase [Cytophagaceae bacterium]
MEAIYNIAEICARKGINNAILSPGSRCAPLTFAFTRHPDFQVKTISDERSAAFVALGISLTTEKPVVLVCTSGSAAYNYAPAVAEAYYSQIPLIVITADRPDEWIDQLDGQTIKQQNIYGSHVKKSYHLPVDHSHPDSVWHINRTINEAINLALTAAKGPVHINVPLREPFYPNSFKPVRFDVNTRIINTIPNDNVINNALLEELHKKISSFQDILIVAGQGKIDNALKTALENFCKKTQAVIIGDIISNTHNLTGAITKHDIILSYDNNRKILSPDLLITFGRSIISKPLKQLLRNNPPKEHWHIDPSGIGADTFQCLCKIIPVSATYFFENVNYSGTNNSYNNIWKKLNTKAENFINNFFHEPLSFNEFSAIEKVMKNLPENILLHLSNSMPVRYANYFSSQKDLEIYCNRGTSGIDGVTSTAMGAAFSGNKQVVLLTGDMAFFYDRNAFWHNYDYKNLRIILLNNHGGGIFKLIDGPSAEPEVDEYFVTKQKLNATSLAKEFNIEHHLCKNFQDIDNCLVSFYTPSEKAKIMEIDTDVSVNTEVFKLFKNKTVELYAK